LPSEWETYAQYWVNGAGKPTIHDVTFAPIPMEKILWGMLAHAVRQLTKMVEAVVSSGPIPRR